jgi:hypothetical protein
MVTDRFFYDWRSFAEQLRIDDHACASARRPLVGDRTAGWLDSKYSQSNMRGCQ